MSTLKRDLFTATTKTPVAVLNCTEAFEKLTKEEKSYAHFLAQAGHYGSLVCLYQVIQ